MNKEELKKESEEYFKNLDKCKTKEMMIDAYVTGAEPREKQIDCLTLACENYREEMEKNLADAVKLEKENADLKIDMDSSCKAWEKLSNEYKKRWEDCKKENAELRAKVTALENANRAMVKELDDMASNGLNILENVVTNKDQLTKAKSLLKQFLTHYENKTIYVENMSKLFSEAEQLLMELHV